MPPLSLRSSSALPRSPQPSSWWSSSHLDGRARMSNGELQAETGSSRTVELLRENALSEVVAFIASARTEDEGDRVDVAPEIAFCQTDPVGIASQYTDFNIRSRHFRIVETF